MFLWLCFARRTLTLNEIISLPRHTSSSDQFDLDDIPEPFTEFLQIGDPGLDAEALARIQAQGGFGTAIKDLDKMQDNSRDNAYNDGVLPVKFQERSM